VTTFYLIRHGEKDADEQLIVARTRGIHLNGRGQRQAADIAAALGTSLIREVFSSPMERARETAEPLARKRNVEVRILEGLQEFEFGTWTGKSHQELAALPGLREFNEFRSATRPPGGETMLEVQTRFVGEMLRLRSEFPNDEIAVVSHGDPIRAAICYFLGMPLDLFDRIEISIGSISVITLTERGAQVTRMNQVPHGEAYR
jgi:broad specificity phosphatase PhoE